MVNSSHYLTYTLESKRQLILSGPARRKESLHPLKDLKGGELKAELQARRSSIEGKKDDLQNELFTMFAGTSRFLALLHKSDVSVEELSLVRYEVLFNEALHCSMNHIKNIL